MDIVHPLNSMPHIFLFVYSMYKWNKQMMLIHQDCLYCRKPDLYLFNFSLAVKGMILPQNRGQWSLGLIHQV